MPDTALPPASQRPLLRRLLLKAGKRFLRWNGEFQTRHSLISTTPQIGNHEFNWVATLEAHWPAIREELDRLLEHPEDIPAFHQISPDQKRISKGDNWKTFGLFVYGQRVDDNCAICPRTAQAISEIPGMRTAMFSILKPHYHIVPHKGPTRAVVRAHLGVDRAKGSGKSCGSALTIRSCTGMRGKVILFDDSYEHEVRNDTDELRAVLFLDIDRPMDKVGTAVNKLLFSLIKSQPVCEAAAEKSG